MAVIVLKIVVQNLDAVLNVFDRIKVHRSTTGEAGPYLEITTPATRVVLEAGVTTYDFTDTDGDPDYFYRVSYFNSTTTQESSLSDPQQGEASAALDVISVEELKTLYLFGVDLTKDDGTPYPDAIFEHYIASAVNWIESRLDLPIIPKAIPEERHDFYRQHYYQFMQLVLDEYPVISVEEVKLVLPTGEDVHTFDPSWVHLFPEAGQVHIVPGAGATSIPLLGIAGIWVPLFRGWGDGSFIPDVFRIKYTAGFATVPPRIKDVVGKVASFGPLNIAGDLIVGAGIASQSLSIDGLSQSINTTSSATNSGYGARLTQYSKELKQDLPILQRYYKGVRLQVA